MSPRSKKEYLEMIFLRYKKASRKEKTVILNEFHKWGHPLKDTCQEKKVFLP